MFMAISLLDVKITLSREGYGKDVCFKGKRWRHCLCGHEIKGTIASSGPPVVTVLSREHIVKICLKDKKIKHVKYAVRKCLCSR